MGDKKKKDKSPVDRDIIPISNLGSGKHLTAKQRKKNEEIRQRRRKVAYLMTEFGLSATDIAAKVDTSPTTALKDMRWLEKAWQKEMAINVGDAKNQAIRRHEYVLREARLSFEKSKRGTKILKKKTKDDAEKGRSEETSREEKNSPGDPRFLEIFQEATDSIASLQGVDNTDIEAISINITMPSLPDEFKEYGLTPQQESQKKIEAAEDAEYEDVPESDDEPNNDQDNDQDSDQEE